MPSAAVLCDTENAMQDIEEYSGLPDDLVGAAKRWIEWLEFERPEDEPLPGDTLLRAAVQSSIIRCPTVPGVPRW